jgi:hypothetical protein
VQFEKRFASGPAFTHPTTFATDARFSGCGADGESQWLKPFGISRISAASLKRSPDTNRFLDCITTPAPKEVLRDPSWFKFYSLHQMPRARVP